jgi:DNA polymerase I
MNAPLVFYSADYDGLELRTMAQACILSVGYSNMARVLNSGPETSDVHLALAASMLGVTYEYAKQHIKTDQVDKARQSAKIANFGFAGGMGAEKLALQARKQYKVVLCGNKHLKQHGDCCIGKARWLKQEWLKAWPEFREYFARASIATERGSGTFKQYFSNRLRGGLTYTEYCNTQFQGLGADATGNAMWLCSKACYVPTPCAGCDGASNGCDRCRACHGPGVSPMYGSRLVNYVHDEIIGECCEPWGHEVAHELGDLMVRGAAPYLPDVPATCKPQLMRFWSKQAEPTWNDGRLVPWDYYTHASKNLGKWMGRVANDNKQERAAA